MPRPSKTVPAYRRHKATGQAVVTLNGRDIYLGAFGTPSSKWAYLRALRRWLGKSSPDDKKSSALKIDDLLAKYWQFAEGYYRRDGEPTGETKNISYACRPLYELFGSSPARDFGPSELKQVRQSMLDSGLCRNVINARIRRIVRIFKWAAAEDLLSASVYRRLKTVDGLKKNRSAARESKKVRPVSWETVERTLPYLPALVADMVRLQWLTGCRPGEICNLRPADVDCSISPWRYIPAAHKCDHLGHVRTILLGPRAREILQPHLTVPAEERCFTPRRSEMMRKAKLRSQRRTKVQPSQRDRSKRNARRLPGERYDRTAYLNAIRRACRKADVPYWTPNQLRHSASTLLRNRFDLETAQVVLGHRKPDTTLLYAEAQLERAAKAIESIG